MLEWRLHSFRNAYFEFQLATRISGHGFGQKEFRKFSVADSQGRDIEALGRLRIPGKVVEEVLDTSLLVGSGDRIV